MNLKISTIAVMVATVLFSCNQGTKTTASTKTEEANQVVTHVMTKEEQAKLTPDQVLQQFIDGNKRFQSGVTTTRDHSEQARKSAPGQFPKAVVLSCLDSRVPVEDVFDQGLGDIFVGRVAGNFVNEDLLGSMEFACKVAGSKLIVVLGHSKCGAVKGACDHVEMGNLTELLSKIQPAVYEEKITTSERSSKNSEFVENVAEINVKRSVRNIIERSFVLEQMLDQGQIGIVGAMHDIESGKVTFYDDVIYIKDELNPDFTVATIRH